MIIGRATGKFKGCPSGVLLPTPRSVTTAGTSRPRTIVASKGTPSRGRPRADVDTVKCCKGSILVCAQRGGRERGLRPFLFPLAQPRGLAPAWRAREQRLRRDFAENELVIAKQRPRDRGDRPSSVEWCQVPLLDGALNLLDEPLR